MNRRLPMWSVKERSSDCCGYPGRSGHRDHESRSGDCHFKRRQRLQTGDGINHYKRQGIRKFRKGKTDDMPIGVIAIDSIYTPVERVNLTVENTRVGQITDFDKLTLDVYTNGTLDPDEAVSLAAKVLSEHLSLFIDLSENAKTAEVMIEKEDNEKEKVLEMSIDELELSVRSYNCLKRAGINTVEELCNRTSDDMMKVRNLGANHWKKFWRN